MKEVLWVCLGGAIGSGARFWLSTTLDRKVMALLPSQAALPFGTLSVNLIGSFSLALLLEIFLARQGHHPALRLALTTGFMGGFTTYSSFNYELMRLLNNGSYGLFGIYLVATVMTCLSSGLLGAWLGRSLVTY